ncbi:MAG: hypothetical protein IJY16_00090 [Clostridia bacterium]|nr:hypothetical protein [Clostridia bacterium]
MKNVFDMNYKRDRWDGDCFKVRTLPADLVGRVDAAAQQRVALLLNEPPRLYRTLRLVFLLLTGFLAVLGLEMLSAGNLPVGATLLVLAAASLVALAVVWVRGNAKRLSDVEIEAELQALDAEMERETAHLREVMSVPGDAAIVDVPSRIYNSHLRTDGETYGNGLCPVFVEEASLCFFDGEYVLAIPFAEITGIVEVKSPLTIDGWMKEVPHTAAPYDAYDITELGEGEDIYRLGSYCAVRCRREGEDYQVIIPRYDIDVILALTGLALTDGE